MLNWFSQKISIIWLKVVITTVAVAVIVLRIYHPDLKIDAITFGLMVVAVLPWLSELIESAKFPGGWEVQVSQRPRCRREGRRIFASASGRAAPAGEASFSSSPSTILTLRLSASELRSRSAFVPSHVCTISMSADHSASCCGSSLSASCFREIRWEVFRSWSWPVIRPRTEHAFKTASPSGLSMSVHAFSLR